MVTHHESSVADLSSFGKRGNYGGSILSAGRRYDIDALYQRVNDHLVGRFDDFVWICVHTIKRVGPVAVFVGAIPGALPPLLGWVAATGSISHEALIIFGIQFIWQFPHFWAIAWVSDDDYKRQDLSSFLREVKKI